MASLGVEFEANYAGNEPDTVFFALERWVGVGIVGEWDTVNLDTPFEYNGHDNLLVEVTWNGTECGDEDAVMQYGPSRDGTKRRAWEFDWQATVAQRADVNEFNLLLGFADAGIEERDEGGGMRDEDRMPSLVRGVLFWSATTPSLRNVGDMALHSADGRRVMDLVPGANDVSRLAPGVYFLHQASGAGRPASGVTKVIVR